MMCCFECNRCLAHRSTSTYVRPSLCGIFVCVIYEPISKLPKLSEILYLQAEQAIRALMAFVSRLMDLRLV